MLPKTKKTITRLISLVVVTTLNLYYVSPISTAFAADYSENLYSLPSVESYTKASGSWTLTNSSRIFVVSDTEPSGDLASTIQLLDAEFASKGLPSSSVMNIVYGDEAYALPNDIVVELVSSLPGVNSQEGYKIEIGSYAKVTALSAKGLFYGTRTIMQYLISKGSMSYGTIVDSPDVQERAFHLDLARKYFTKDWVISLIKEMSWMKLNTLQLHFSENEGFRFKLNDMKVDGVDCSGIVSSSYLSESDMDEIIATANKYKIQIVPSFDSPGHMGQILNSFSSYRLSGSSTTLDLNNSSAVAFSKGLISKYAAYFSSKGSKYFHIGGDESDFINGITSTTNSKYVTFYNYINSLASIIKSYGMTPRMWNDAIITGAESLYDSDIQVTMWDPNYNKLAHVEDLLNAGHDVLNFASDYVYYCVSNSPIFWCNYETIYNGTNTRAAVPSTDKGWNPGKFSQNGDHRQQMSYSEGTGFYYPNSANASGKLIGASFAVWSDVPNSQTEAQVATNIYYKVRAVAERAWAVNESSIVNPVNGTTSTAAYDTLSYSAFRDLCSTLGTAPGGFTSSGSAGSATLPTPSSFSPVAAVTSGVVIISYVDDAGVTIKSPTSITGEEGESYTITPEAIYGYTTPSSVSGTFTSGTKNVTLVYVLNTNKTALQTEVDAIVDQGSYSDETYGAYTAAIEAARTILSDTRVTQTEVDASLQNILNTKNNLAEAPVEPETITITSNRSFYQTYTGSKAIDSDTSSYAWVAYAQRAGDYLQATFDGVYSLKSVAVTSNFNADYIRSANILVSTDGNSWTNIGSISASSSSTTPMTVTLSEAVKAKYVRISLTSTSNNWWVVNDLSFGFTSAAEQPKEQSITVHYVDDAGVKLKNDTTLTGVVGEAYSITPEAIYGYTTPAAITGTYSEDINEINVVYVLNTNKAGLKTELDNILPAADYTEGSYAPYQSALTNGQSVYSNARATQTMVDSAVSAITSAKASLKLAPVSITVTVHYVDDAGLKLKNDTTITGLEGDSYTITAEAMYGYKTPATIEGTYSEDVSEINVIYVLNTNKTTLKTELDNILSPNSYTTDSYAVYEAAIANGQTIYSNVRSTQTAVDAAVTAITSAKENLKLAPVSVTVTVHYVDDAGIKLKNDTTITGNAGNSYSITPEAIYGYTTPATIKGTYSENVTEINVVYVLNTNKTALKAELDNVLPSADYTEDSYAPYQSAITNGQAIYNNSRATETTVDAAVSAILTAKANLKEVTVAPKSITMTIHYVDDAGLKLKNDTIITGLEGDSYTITAEAMYGYNTPAAIEGTYSEDVSEINIIYVLNTNKTALKTELDNILSPNSYTADSYAVYEAAIANGQTIYSNVRSTQTAVDAAVEAITSAKANLKLAPVSVTVTVHYVDDAGLKLKNDTTITGNAGNSYSITPEAIYGYTTPATINGTYSENVTEINVVYVLNTNKTALKTELDNILSPNSYTTDSYAAYEAAIANGQTIYSNARSTQTVVDAAVAAITSAKANLVLVTTSVPESITITSNRSFYSSYYGSKAIDGNNSSFAWVGYNQNVGDYIQAEFDGVYALNTIEILSNHSTDYIRSANIQVSVDGNTWTTIGNIAGSANSSSLMTVALNSPVSAKYVRISLTTYSYNWWIVNEISFTFNGSAVIDPEPEVTADFLLDNDGIDSGAEYIIKSGSNGYALSVSGSSISRTAVDVEDDGINLENDNAVWIVKSSGSGYTLQNKGTGYYLSISRNSLTLSTSPYVFSYTNSGSYAKFYGKGSRYYYYLRYSSSKFSIGTSSTSSYNNMLLYKNAD